MRLLVHFNICSHFVQDGLEFEHYKKADYHNDYVPAQLKRQNPLSSVKVIYLIHQLSGSSADLLNANLNGDLPPVLSSQSEKQCNLIKLYENITYEEEISIGILHEIFFFYL